MDFIWISIFYNCKHEHGLSVRRVIMLTNSQYFPYNNKVFFHSGLYLDFRENDINILQVWFAASVPLVFDHE